MPNLPDIVSRPHLRLLTSVSIAAAGTLCPIFIPAIAAAGSVATGIGGIITGVAGSMIAADMVAYDLNRISVKLRGSENSLANEDIIKACGLAVGLLIKSVAESGNYAQNPTKPQDTTKLTLPEIEKLEKLALAAAESWTQLIAKSRDGNLNKLETLQEKELNTIFAKKGEDFFEQEVLNLEDWKIILGEGWNSWRGQNNLDSWDREDNCQSLCALADIELDEKIIDYLAHTLCTRFAKALREVLKADFEEGGKAFAGLTLSMLGEMLSILRAGTPAGDNSAVLQGITAIEALQQQLDQKNQEGFKKLGEGIDSGFEAVMAALGIQESQIRDLNDWLRGELQRVSQQLAGIKEDTSAIRKTVEATQSDATFIKETVEHLQADMQNLQEISEEALRLMKAQEKSRVQTVSFVLDTNPAAVTNWQGREQDLATVNGWLDDENSKLGIIVGIGGMGKSTLAAKVFHDRTDDFVDKLWIDLGQRPTFRLVAKGIIEKFGKPSPEQLEQLEKLDEVNLIQVLINVLGQERFLLVWDNFETVVEDEGYGQFLQQWLGKCHNSEILITTQEMPNLGQEKPDELPLQGLTDEAGGQLLADLKVGGSRQELAEFSRRVNGHPLTLRAVAGLLTNEIGDGAALGELAGLGLLDLGQLLPRLQKTHRQEVYLVAVLGISFGRLAPELQRVLLSLVVLRRSFDAGMAAEISGEVVTDHDLRGLVKRGFLTVEERGSYTFQPFILEYLKYKAGDLTIAHQKAIEFYQGRFKPRAEWQTVADVQEYLEVFYHLCQLGEYSDAFDVIRNGVGIDDVNDFLSLRGNNQILVELYQQLITHLPDHQDWRYRASLTSLGNTYYFLGRYDEAIDKHQQSLVIQREIGNRQGEANSLNNLGLAYNSLGRYQEAIDKYKESLVIAREIGNRRGEANSLNGLGNAYDSLGSYHEAIDFQQQSLVIAQEIGDRQGESNSLIGLGNAYSYLGRYQKAITFERQSLAIAKEIGSRREEARSLISLGSDYIHLQYDEKAIDCYQKSIIIAGEIGDRLLEAKSLGGLGNAYDSLRHYQEAIYHHEQSLLIRQEIEDKRGAANELLALGYLYKQVGRIKEGNIAKQQALAIYQELDLPLDAYPIANWQKKLIKFAQSSKFKFILCIILGIFAFPFALVGFTLLTLDRLLRTRLPRP